jgi:hypothetical protein
VIDDGKGGPLTSWWAKVSGPGNAVFGNSNLVATAVSFDRAGAYVLRLSATDTQAEMSSDLNVVANPNPNIYEDWIGAYYPGATNQSVVGTLADPDGDAAQNLLEFALGMNPAVSDAISFAPGQPGLPRGTIQNFTGTNYLSLIVRRPIGRIGITYAAEVSGDLALWTAGILQGSPINNGDGSESAIFRDTLPVSQFPHRFIRLKVQKVN